MSKEKSILPGIPKKETIPPVKLASSNIPTIVLEEKKTYSELLKHPKWQKKRLLVMQRDKFACRLCKDEETTLHIHHKSYAANKKPWEYEDSNLVTLCEHCHTFVEQIKPTSNKINFDKALAHKKIKDSGFFICAEIGGNAFMATFKSDNSVENWLSFTAETLSLMMPIFKSCIKNG